MLAHVAGVKAVVCNNCWDACGCLNCKNRAQKVLKQLKLDARVADPFCFAFDATRVHLFEYRSVRSWSKETNRTLTGDQKN